MPISDGLNRCETCNFKKDFGNPAYGFIAKNGLAKCYVIITECPQKEWDLLITKATKEPENL